MTRYICLLRGVNLGGNNMIAMADLKAHLSKNGYRDVQTLLQSGNVVFSGPKKSTAALERELESEIRKRFELTIDLHVRRSEEWLALVERNPFPEEARKNPSAFMVTCFKKPLDPSAVDVLRDGIAAIRGRELLHADGRHLYMFFPSGYGASKSRPLVDRKLPKGTTRNWNTVLKLAAICQR
jgi:uncharacterized protein (DUF1697 family)